MVGLSVMCLGSLEEKLRLLFELYDVNGTGTLEAEEIFAMSTTLYKLMEIEALIQPAGKSLVLESPLGKYDARGGMARPSAQISNGILHLASSVKFLLEDACGQPSTRRSLGCRAKYVQH